MSNVHIVAAEWDTDQVLARLIRYLVSYAGWTVSNQPDPEADLNYFLPYLLFAQKNRDFKATPTAGYFSHHDTSSPEKAAWWREAAQHIDLRIVTAMQYGKLLRGYGETAYCHAGVELEHFKPLPRESKNALPTVGVSGMVYGDGRKGEQLVSRLYMDTHNMYNWRAAGRGWNVGAVQWYDWADLPKFYQKLDLFICASLIEGVPMPPLEALASGVPIVIPEGVGMLDELPKTPGIHRFKKGDYDSLKAAVAKALQTPCDPELLRKAVQDWSVNAWVDDNVEAIESFLEPALNIPGKLPEWHGNSGVYIVAYGAPARTCAKRAIASWQRYNPYVPVALVSDSHVGSENILIQHADEDVGARKVKVKIDTLAPVEWNYVLYLDADTETIAPVTLFFDLLQDGYELVICKNPVRFHTTRYMVRPDNHEECEKTFEVMGTDDQLQLNGGVFAFRRCDRVSRFFELWLEEWNRYGKRDQAALLRALWRHPLRLMVLGNEWNTVDRYYDPEMSAGILHHPMEARRWEGTIQGRLDSPAAWKAVKK
jgi:hypothetical protein